MIVTRRLLLLIGTASCLQVIPESVKILYTNDKYVENVVFNVRRYNRNSPYYLNLYGTLKYTWANNVTIHSIFTEYLHNEYRRSFIEQHNKICDLINEERYIGGMFREKGVVCPMPKGSKWLAINFRTEAKHICIWVYPTGGSSAREVLSQYEKRAHSWARASTDIVLIRQLSPGAWVPLRKVGLAIKVSRDMYVKIGKYELRNLTMNTSEFPNVWPFEKGGVNMDIVTTDTGEPIMKAELHVKFIQKKIGKKSLT